MDDLTPEERAELEQLKGKLEADIRSLGRKVRLLQFGVGVAEAAATEPTIAWEVQRKIDAHMRGWLSGIHGKLPNGVDRDNDVFMAAWDRGRDAIKAEHARAVELTRGTP